MLSQRLDRPEPEGEVEILGVADLDRTIRLRFALTHAGEVDVREAFQEYTERGTTLTRPFEATQVRNLTPDQETKLIYNSFQPDNRLNRFKSPIIGLLN